MDRTYLQEAFKQLEILTEEDFNLTQQGAEDMKDFVDADEKNDFVDIIDPEAETEEDLKDSYVGKVILDCVVCHSKLYKDATEVKLSEDGELANVDEECPFCYTTDGFKIIGQVAPFKEPDEVKVEVEPKEAAEVEAEAEEDELEESCNEEVCPECGKNPCECEKEDEELHEDLEKVELETENEKIKIETEPKEEIPGAEMVAPVTGNTEDVIEASSEPVEEEEVVEPEVEDEVDYDVDDFSEDEFDELGEAYLKNIYENVESFKTASVKTNENKLTVEGIIKFNSGREKQTQFIFEAKDATKNGRVRFVGENCQISRGKRAFTLTGKMDNNKFFAESLNYNYRAKNNEGKSTRVYGTVKVNG